MLKNFILVGLMAASISAYAEAIPDISGVKLRAPLASQKSLIEKINPQYQLSDIKTTDGRVVGIQGLAFSSKTKGVIDQFVALQDDVGNIWYLGRAQIYEEGNYIPQATFATAFKEKYGSPTDISGSNQLFWWTYDRNNALKDHKGAAGLCPSLSGQDISKINGLSLQVPRTFGQNCGIQINGGLSITIKGNMVFNSTVQIVDHKTRYDALEKQKMAEDAVRQKNLDSMKDNKPKL